MILAEGQTLENMILFKDLIFSLDLSNFLAWLLGSLLSDKMVG